MNVNSVSFPATPPVHEIRTQDPLMSIQEIRTILYLGVHGGVVDNPKEVDNHTIDTYA